MAPVCRFTIPGRSILLCLGLLLTLLASPLSAQVFGQNKVQYGVKEWSFIQTDHFDIYYYQGGYDQAVFTARTADSAYVLLTRDYNWELPADQRIVIVTYQSHNDFSSTNLTYGVVPESVGGFTEFYRNRVVVPFQGDWEAYRHVIHHELNHAFQLAMFYGDRVLAGVIRFPLPLWFVEGSSEYTSRGGWDREANMFMADAVISGYLPDIPYLGGFLAYKGGQSVFCYLEDEFGRERVAELNHKVRSLRSVERGLESSLGFGLEELSRQWKDYLQRMYWPGVQGRRRARDFADRVTDHTRLGNFVNNSPAISPEGDRMVYLSDRTGYFDLYLAHITEPEKARRLLQGQQSGNFEELHWLQPGIAWSPDGERIAFASKAGAEDALFLLDARSGQVLQRWSFGLKGLFSPAFSPDGRHIAFVASLRDEATSGCWRWTAATSPLSPRIATATAILRSVPMAAACSSSVTVAMTWAAAPLRCPLPPGWRRRRSMWRMWVPCWRTARRKRPCAASHARPTASARPCGAPWPRRSSSSATREALGICGACPPPWPAARRPPCPSGAPTCSPASSSLPCPPRDACSSPVSSRGATTSTSTRTSAVWSGWGPCPPTTARCCPSIGCAPGARRLPVRWRRICGARTSAGARWTSAT